MFTEIRNSLSSKLGHQVYPIPALVLCFAGMYPARLNSCIWCKYSLLPPATANGEALAPCIAFRIDLRVLRARSEHTASSACFDYTLNPGERETQGSRKSMLYVCEVDGS